jgi:hypothetical protein
MEEQDLLVVHPPDDRGLRAVSVGDRTLGQARSLRDLRGILGRAGYPGDMDLEDRARVRWDGGGIQVWPDRRWRRLAGMTLMMAGLAVSAGVLGSIGADNATAALTYVGRIEGVVFLTAGLVEAVAVIAVVDQWNKRLIRASGAFVLAGIDIAFAAALLLLTLQLYGGEVTPYLFLWVALLLWYIWAFRETIRWKIRRKIVHYPKGLTAGVIAYII